MTTNLIPPPPQPVLPWYGRRWVQIVAVAVAALLVGTGIGAASAETDADDLTAERDDLAAQVDELENREPEVVTETETVEVEVTPQSCVTALDLAQDTFAVGSEALGLVVEWLDLPAGSAAEAANEAEQDALLAEMEANVEPFQDAAAQCRGDV